MSSSLMKVPKPRSARSAKPFRSLAARPRTCTVSSIGGSAWSWTVAVAVVALARFTGARRGTKPTARVSIVVEPGGSPARAKAPLSSVVSAAVLP